MPASSGLYRIKNGRVLDRLQKPAALIFIIAYIAACGICDHTASASPGGGKTVAATMTTPASEPSVRHINQNLIMSQSKEGEPVPVPQPYAQSAASAGGSSITSFDSTNVIDGQSQPTPTHLQEAVLQTHSHSRIQAKDTAGPYPIPVHRPEPVENHLEANNGIEGGMESLFGTPMHFGTENSTVVTTQIGATAHVPCTVHHIGEGVVSWIRKKDYHLLTVGLTTYSSDERFSATHLKHSEDWTLQIKFVQLRDAGVYECQVSTHPPTSIFLHLSVVEARAEITGPPIRYLTPGSTLRLQCRVVQNTEASEYIFWYHDNRMINYDIDRGINVSTEPDFQSSELTIQRTRREHSGNFTCVASNTQPASVLVHIFKGDNPAAMYHGHVGGSTKTTQSQLHMIMIIIASGYRIFHTSVYMKIV
uniref:IP04217p n=1 Tax=Drosophila melanogaster TaxID=7227 RepID=C5WLT5_DROME|nr:IP04217p [Drosophila melanogaster]